jgi:hypothetical protein
MAQQSKPGLEFNFATKTAVPEGIGKSNFAARSSPSA